MQCNAAVLKLLMLTGRCGMDVAVVVTGSSDHRWRRKGSSGHVVAQLLESPLPTPRRSCCGWSADTPAARRGCASPQRGHVPFKWESSPGVPKSAAAAGGGKAELFGEAPPPKPPPGRCGTCHVARAPARAYHHRRHSNTRDSSSDQQNDDDDDDTLSDALDRISSSNRLAALSARLSAIDGAVFGSRRSPSFIMDRFLPAANAIATTSADKHPRRPSPRRPSKSKRDWEAEAEAAAARARFVTHIRRRALAFELPKHPTHCQREDAAAAAQLPPCAKEEAQGEQMTTPRACGFVFFVPWSAKPVRLGFQRSPARSRSRTPRGDVASVTTASSSPPRRSATLGDVLEKDRKLRDGGGLPHWCDEKSGSGKECANPGWGMALLGTSKRYCADARKALSRLTRSGMDSSDSPRIGRERSSSKHKQAASMLRSTAVEMPPLSPPSESWLSNARRSNAGVTKVEGACDRRERPFEHK